MAKRRKKRRLRKRLTYQAALNRLRRRMPAKVRAGLAQFKRFHGVRMPPNIKRIEMPGPRNKEVILVGMGRSPAINLANGPEGKASRFKRIRRNGLVATDVTGRKIVILSGRGSKSARARLTAAGYVPATEYVPTKALERAGTNKAGRHWIHDHGRKEKGRWPKARRDQAGNVHYTRGTYRVKKWIYH